jgi:starch synthase (maltosyl-transferring)
LTELLAAPGKGCSVRPVVEAVSPVVDGGRFLVKREVGDTVTVEADVFCDGSDEIACELRWRHQDAGAWTTAPMARVENDRWRGSFVVDRLGIYRFALRAGVDHLATWASQLPVRRAAGQDLSVEFLVGADLLDELASRARAGERRRLAETSEQFRQQADDPSRHDALVDAVRRPEVISAGRRYLDPSTVAVSDTYGVMVARRRARSGSWYELFPRSASSDPGRDGTFKDVEARLPYLEGLGVDVLYLPPIHPIGRTNRKGRDGAAASRRDDPGSPWAIGSVDGGHDAVAPALGTLADFEHLLEAAAGRGIEIALDLAFQCSPDHPWISQHPEWFKTLPDGTVRYAENPPKRYEDIYPIDFETRDWRPLWEELARIVLLWAERGVRIFRVDNPHTKSLRFWEWLIANVKARHPDVVFLSEAFTRPKLMYHLAKSGFDQSYTYFAWRSAKWELTQYLSELHSAPVAEFFRANLWPNTPDILTDELQHGGRGAFVARLVLAGTMASSYGVYGPAFELQEHLARNPGSEEYLHSEKYEVRRWNLDDPTSLAPLVAALNRARRDNAALQFDRNLRFHSTDNDQLIAYSRHAAGCADAEPNTVVVVVSLDHQYTQSGWIDLDLDALGIDENVPFDVEDLLSGARFTWAGRRNWVSLDPAVIPAHVLGVTRGTTASSQGQPRDAVSRA